MRNIKDKLIELLYVGYYSSDVCKDYELIPGDSEHDGISLLASYFIHETI